MIRITAKRAQGFYRCGVFHSAQPTDYPNDRFSKPDLKRLRDEPHLSIEFLDGEPEFPPEGQAGDGGTGDAELAEERERLAALESNLAERKAALDAADAAMTERQRIIDGLLENETFRAIALRYGVQRVVAGKAEADFMKNGAPKTEAISREALGIECSAKERDALVAELSPPK